MPLQFVVFERAVLVVPEHPSSTNASNSGVVDSVIDKLRSIVISSVIMDSQLTSESGAKAIAVK